MAKKVQLRCTKTAGRYNKGDVIGVSAETAETYLSARGSVWEAVAGKTTAAAAAAAADAKAVAGNGGDGKAAAN